MRGSAEPGYLYRECVGRPARRNFRRRAPQIPARRHQLSDDRRCGRPHHGPGPSHGLCAERVGPDQCRHPAAGPLGDRLCRRRGDALQALRRPRLHRRRQIDQRVAAAQRDSQGAAEPADFPARRPQRVWPLLRRPRAGAQPAQPETAVLAVQFRRNRRRAVRRPSGRARRARHPRRSHSDGERHLHPVSELRPARAQARGPENGRLYRRYAGAIPAGRL